MDVDDNHRGWTERSGDLSLEYYAQIGLNKTSETLVTVFERYTAEGASILELGCGSGRHLAHPHDRGYEDIIDIDISDDSSEVVVGYLPGPVNTGMFLTDAIEDLLPNLPDDKLDVIYSVEMFQHVHPGDTWVFEGTVHVSSDLVIAAENEGNGSMRGHPGPETNYISDDFPLYHRSWKDEFPEFGLARLLCEPGKRDTARAFRIF